MSLTTDPNHPDLTKGVDENPTPQAKVYIVLSEDERNKGFIRPYRDTYIHVGEKLKYNFRELTEEEKERYVDCDYVLFEIYPAEKYPTTGKFWTQKQLDNHGCGKETKMSRELAETYARNPKFYGATYCVHCQMHRPVNEFLWLDGEILGS